MYEGYIVKVGDKFVQGERIFIKLVSEYPDASIHTARRNAIKMAKGILPLFFGETVQVWFAYGRHDEQIIASWEGAK